MARTAAAILLLLWCVGGGRSEFFAQEILAVPPSEFVGSVESTMSVIRQVVSTVAPFVNAFGDFRQRNAVSDCLDLMDLSLDQMSLSISAMQHPYGKGNGTGNAAVDMRTWLSGALINQDTCKEGFDGTDGLVRDLVAGSLDQITSLVYDILSTIKSVPKFYGNEVVGRLNGRKLIGDDRFPEWIRPRDRRLLQSGPGFQADAVVAADGTGNFTRISEAVHAAPDYSTKRFIIYVKGGVYNEYVEISKKKWNVMLIGDGINSTVISGNRNFIDGWTTYRSATFAVKGQGFIARDLTIENTAGPEKHQAVAFRSDSDLSVIFRCAIRGYQDTLYAHSQRQFYRECTITGTIDFIFGDGTVVFQSCEITARKGLPNQKNTVTAQGRKEPVENTGFSIQFSKISGEADLLADLNATQTYLGRPWRSYSRTVIMQSYIGEAIRPEGWLEWNGNVGLDTLFYAEYMNYGPGAAVQNRVKWPGFHALSASSEAVNYTVAQFIGGNAWLPATGVRYSAGFGV
ncbi:pectinesterase [Genlisea aurea]|uniref:Pectinesterase n=1 Tax=Genlisea aurea TaxID=192259 RepID=S8DLB0_9LAMI|nr:pectinesterase [Genlisea aurea]